MLRVGDSFSGGLVVLGDVFAMSILSLLASGFWAFKVTGAPDADLGESMVPLACPVESGSFFSGFSNDLVKANGWDGFALSATKLSGELVLGALLGLATTAGAGGLVIEFWLTWDKFPWLLMFWAICAMLADTGAIEGTA